MTTGAEIREAGKCARATAKTLTTIVEARYTRANDAFVIQLNTGSSFTIPRGRALWFEAADTGVRLETLMIAAAGENTVCSAASQLLGSRTIAKKASSSAENGKRGGRPPKRTSPPSRQRKIPGTPGAGGERAVPAWRTITSRSTEQPARGKPL